MSESKRVTLTTINDTVLTTGASTSFRFGADFLPPSSKTGTEKNACESVRLNIELFQTDSNKYPEFNYSKLLHLEKKRLKKTKQKPNGLADIFEENDGDAMERIAKELERKYGSSYGGGRSKNKRGDYDIGMGYDESDSFIDNTEAYDEIIPDEVETIEGGFYINCGALEFKKLHTESLTTKTDEIIKMPNRPSKRVISSSSEESSSSEDDEEDDESDDEDEESIEESPSETTKSKGGNVVLHKKANTSTNGDGAKQLSKSQIARPENSNDMKKSIHSTVIKNHIVGGLSCSSSNSPKQTDGGRSDSEKERMEKKVEKTTTVKDMLKARRDHFLKSQHSTDTKAFAANGDNKIKSSDGDDGDNDDDGDDETLSEDSDDRESEDNSDSNESVNQQQQQQQQQAMAKPGLESNNKESAQTEKLRTADTKLPEMDGDALSNIIEFRDSSLSKNLVGKRFQFTEQLIEQFLKIDDALILDRTQRNTVYAHLEFQLSLPKYYFLRKVKQLRIKEEKLKSKRAFHKLHKAVTEVMPAVTTSYEAELRKYAELQAANVNCDQPLKMPKKKFPWNHNLRNLLYDVYQMRWTSYPVLGTRKETLEIFLGDYMRQKVVKIWPNGWMSYEELQGEIEKRKIAVNKNNERKKAGPTAAASKITSSELMVTAVAAPTTTAVMPPSGFQITPPVSLLAGLQHGQNAFMKQFEEFANSRSNANSDTDSVASSSTSNSLKRKNCDLTASAASGRQSKAKIVKSNSDQTKVYAKEIKQLSPVMELTTSGKRTDHSISHIMVSAVPATSSAASLTLNNTTAPPLNVSSTAISSLPFKPTDTTHTTHVIDLDNYTNLCDILNTTKSMPATSVSVTVSSSSSSSSSSSISRPVSNLRRESSGDSEIEIVGVYKATKNMPKQRTTKSHNRTNSKTSMYQLNMENIAAFAGLTKINNTTGKYSKPNKTKQANSMPPSTVVGDVELNKMNESIQSQLQVSTVPPHLKPQ